MRWIVFCAVVVGIVGCDGNFKLPDFKLTKPKDDTVIVNPDPSDPVEPVPVTPKDFNAAVASDALAKRAEAENSSPLLSSQVLDGMLTIASKEGELPAAYIAKVRTAVPAIGIMPPRDLTTTEVAALRAVR
jgi:hypothetical protein